jgi:hypothetical protein
MKAASPKAWERVMASLLFACVTQTAPERHIDLGGVLRERGTSFLAESGTPGQGW